MKYSTISFNLSVLLFAEFLALGTCDDHSVLEIAHVNDHHSHLDSEPIELYLDGVRTRMRFGSLPALAGIFNSLPSSVLRIHAGDALTGTLYYTLFKGQADAALMNTICFDIFVLGNHEFDDGDGVLQRFLDSLKSGPCNTTVLSANVIPQVGTPLAVNTEQDYIIPWTSRVINGMPVAVVGITVRNKTMLSSRPLPTTRFLDEQTAAQAAIDDALAHGFKHVVLVTHQGYRTDLRMAQQLRGVDVIIGGDSHSLLGNWSGTSMPTEGPYPTVVRNADGEMVCVGQAWEFSKAFGRMRIEFDARGAVSSCSGNVILPVAHNSDPVASLVSAPSITRHTLLVDPRFNAPYGGQNELSAREFDGGMPTGYGSGLAFAGVSGGSYQFYAVTDRGPTEDGPARALGAGIAALGPRAGRLESISEAFAAPGFAPSIGLITVGDGAAVLSTSMPIRTAGGARNASGLPPPAGTAPGLVMRSAFRYASGGAVGELPLGDMFAFAGFDDEGLDPEAVAYDGERQALWVSDEYGPCLVKVDAANGTVLKKYRPGAGATDLPGILSQRRPGRGLAGLCLDKATGKLHGVLQSPIDPRDSGGKSKRVSGTKVRDGALFLRWLEFDPAAESSKVYALPIDGALFEDGEAGEAKLGDIACLGGGKFVVILQGDRRDEPHEVFNWLSLVQIPPDSTDIKAMDESLEISSMTGAPFNGVNYAEISSLHMTKLLDLNEAGWDSEKAEGLALVDDSTLALINDNDFGVSSKVTSANDTVMSGKDIEDCLLVAVSGQFVDCTEDEGYSDPPARMTRAPDKESVTSLWLIRFGEPLVSLFPLPPIFERYNTTAKAWAQVSDAEASVIEDILGQDSADSMGAKVIEVDEGAARVLKQYSLPMIELRKAVIGQAGETLCFGRVPGRGNVNPNSPECVAATREQGSTMTQVVAESLLNVSRRAVIAIQNAGGVRQGILAGDITIDTTYLVLPFSNSLYELEMTGQEILDTLEDAGQFAVSTSSGSHPYAAGMRWCFNRSSSKGSRFTNVEVRDRYAGPGAADSSWQPLVMTKTYIVAGNDYIVSGQDGYATLRKVQQSGRGVNTYMDCTQILIDYISLLGPVFAPPKSDFSHKPVSKCTKAASTLSSNTSASVSTEFDLSSSIGKGTLVSDTATIAILQTKAITNSSAQLSSDNTLSFTAIRESVGNLSRCLALAQLPFSPVFVSPEQLRELVSVASRLGPAPSGKIQGRSLSVFAAPGVILETVASEVYPAGFGMGVETYMPFVTQSNLSNALSGVVKFTQIFGRPLAFQLTAFPLAFPTSTIPLPCPSGVETRLTKLGAPLAFACTCPASAVCGGKSACTINPKSGEEWVITQIPKGLCTGSTAVNSGSSSPGFTVIAGIFLIGCAAVYGYRRFVRNNSTARRFLHLSDDSA